MNSKLTLEQKDASNVLIQELVSGVSKRWNGKGGIGAKEAYELIDRIYEILHNGENKDDILRDKSKIERT